MKLGGVQKGTQRREGGREKHQMPPAVDQFSTGQ